MADSADEPAPPVPSPDAEVAGVVLAGGRSARFGRPKAQAMFAGRAMLARVVDALRGVCGGGLFVVGGDPRWAEAAGASYLADAAPGEGPLGGLVTAARATSTPRVFLAACDMPLLSASLVRAIVDAWTEEADLVTPTTARGDEPLASLYGRRALTVLEAAFEAGVRRLQPWPSTLVVRRLPEVSLPQSQGLRGANTPQELGVLAALRDADARARLESPGHRLARRVGGIADEEMRRTAMRTALQELAPAEAAAALEAILLPDSPRASMSAKAAASAVSLFTTGPSLPYLFAAELYEAAVTRGYEAVRRLLLRGGAQRKPGEGELVPDPRVARRSLGERKYLARKSDPDLIDRLLFDPDPSVLTNLLANPRMTEREAVRIASHRPGVPDVLRLVASHPRWARRESVRRALVRNPYTPSEIGANLAPFLLDQDLRAIAADETLHEQVRQAAREVLDIRHHRS